jgi:MFS family permease
MTIEPYRRVLAIPGARTLLAIGLFARIPSIAVGLTLTLHVVNDMKLGFLRAGLVGAALTGGVALSAPAAGRVIDRYGIRPLLAITTAAQLVFWSSAAFLPYWLLVGGVFLDGILALPVSRIINQCLTAAVPAEQRRTVFSLNSMLTEVSYMIGPAVAVAAIGAFGSAWTMGLVGLGLLGSGSALLVLNPPIRAEHELEEAGSAGSPRRWLTPPLGAVFAVTFTAALVMTSTELSLVATLKADGAVRWAGLALALWCLWSLIGGFVYGVLPRGLSPLVIVGVMAALTVPVGLAGHWPLLCLLLVPSCMLTAPAMTTTVDTVSRCAPAAARGEAMGLYGTAFTLGGAVSSPIAGSVIDGWSPRWSFAVMGLIGVCLVTSAVPFWRRVPRRAAMDGTTAEATTGAV